MRERRILLATDKDYLTFQEQAHAGIILVRLRQPNAERIHRKVVQALYEVPEESWPGTTIVMRDNVHCVSRNG